MTFCKGNMEVYHNAISHKKEIQAIALDLEQNSVSRTGLYKFFTKSFKVYFLQKNIREIYELLQVIAGEQLNKYYEDIVIEAISTGFIINGRKINFSQKEPEEKVASLDAIETNLNWAQQSGKILLAYLLSERILLALLKLCNFEGTVTEDILIRHAFSELYAIFRT